MYSNPVNRLNDKYLRLYGIPISVMTLLLVQMPFYFPDRWDLLWKYAVVSIFFTGSMWEISRIVLIHVRNNFPSLAQTKQRISWMFLLFTIQLGIGQALITQTVISMGLAAVSSFSFVQIWLINFTCSLFFIVVISSVYEAIYFFEQYRNALQKSEHLKKQQVLQRLEALKTRVNPHFLFNALTTLSALIGEDAPRAERFVDELSKVYRYLLRAGRQPMVTLEEELQFADSYVFLLQNRFEAGAFSFTDNCRGNSKSPREYALLEHNLPALVFQNALDYFVRTQNLPLHIQAEMRENELLITGKFHPKNRSIDVSDHDWAQLEHLGARQALISGQLTMFIPLPSKTLIS